jgi:hypothetical protein
MLPDIESCGNSRLFSAPSEQLHKRGFSTVFWARIWPAEGPLLPLTLRLSSVILQLASGGTGHQKYDLKGCVLGLRIRSGSSSGVERKLPKLDVAGSTPVSRSKFSAFPPFPGRPGATYHSLVCGQTIESTQMLMRRSIIWRSFGRSLIGVRESWFVGVHNAINSMPPRKLPRNCRARRLHCAARRLVRQQARNYTAIVTRHRRNTLRAWSDCLRRGRSTDRSSTILSGTGTRCRFPWCLLGSGSGYGFSGRFLPGSPVR